ncbi:hypothetical protein JQ604_15130 [Bradyrhizobium jicamae]|uniref:hypothetical protein n=1 Tax=Bradyrhizobium jicamae TaxID=280332 RepID=UPI001BA7B173|nr:hypothetical protein [Bradyrhizobium jicamae]MBR0753520.1 hypothetical protein [Bradyrhizobium jicamae]
MKYNQPYGVSDPNAPYINGNPSTGQAGSIPPAASIEYPQREIVNLLTDVNIAVPANSDLHQLAKAIQSQRLNYSADYGTANAYVAHLAPAPDDYFAGMVCRVKIGATNAGDSTLALYPLSPKHVVRPDGTNLQQYDLIQGQVATFVYDGAQWVLTGINSAGSGGPIYLTAPRTYYVNGNTGDDNFDGSQAAVGPSPKGPFRTLQRASNSIAKFNLNGYNVDVYVADATYAPVQLPQVAGQGQVSWHGNNANPAACLIAGNQTNSCIGMAGVANYMSGFKVTHTGVGSISECNGIYGNGPWLMGIDNFEWGPTVGAQNRLVNGSQLRFGLSAFKISGGTPGGPYSPGCFIECSQASKADCPLSVHMTLNIVGTPNYGTAFIRCFDVGVVDWVADVTGAATGMRYYVATNGILNTGGGGPNYVPGSIPGTQLSGGQYV